jgi:hypothetical protein
MSPTVTGGPCCYTLMTQTMICIHCATYTTRVRFAFVPRGLVLVTFLTITVSETTFISQTDPLLIRRLLIVSSTHSAHRPLGQLV